MALNKSIEKPDYLSTRDACRADYLDHGRESSLRSLATSLGELGDWLALKELYSRVDEKVLRADLRIIAATYLRRGGQTEKADADYRAAVKIYREFERPKELGKALYFLFKHAWLKSDHKAALAYAGEALKTARESDNQSQEVSALSNLVKVFQEVGNVGAAQHALNQQKPLLSEYASLGQRIDADINQGLIHLDSENFGLSVFSFEKALAAAAGSNNHSALRGLHLNLVLSNLKLGRLVKAEDHLKKAWSYANSDDSGHFALNYFQSMLYQRQGKLSLAYDSVNKALSDPTTPDVWKWEFHYQAGRVAQDLGENQKAIEYYLAAIRASDNLREAIGFNDLKAHLLSRKRQPYEALFLIYLEGNEFNKAFSIAEQAKSKSFIEAYLHNQTQGPPNLTAVQSEYFSTDLEARRIDDLLLHLELMRSSPVLKPRSAHETYLQARSISDILILCCATTSFYNSFGHGGAKH